MSFKSFLTKFTIFYILSTIAIGVFFSLIGKHANPSPYMLATAILITHLGAEHLIFIKKTLNKKLFFKLFFSILFIITMYSIFSLILLFGLEKFLAPFFIKAFFTALILHVFTILLGLWGANGRAKKVLEKNKIKFKKIYTAIDELIAEYFISLFHKEKIDAMLENKKDNNLFNQTTNLANINILVDNTKIYRANQIIESYFKEQEKIEAWNCPKCHEHVDSGFSSCWNCQYDLEENSSDNNSKSHEPISQKNKAAPKIICISCNSDDITYYSKYYQCNTCKWKYKLKKD